MESTRCVSIANKVSGQILGIVRRRPHHEWTTFVIALHYYAARVCDVPVWCVQLFWEDDPWDDSHKRLNMYIQCLVTNNIPEITPNTDLEDGRCCNCWEDCDEAKDAYERRRKNGVIFSTRMQDFYDASCEDCNARFLCDLCRVCLPGGRGTCLECFVPTPLDRLDLISQSVWVEDAAAYEARVEDALPSLTKAQRSRWLCVAAPVRL
jgi:hypothetical protein